MAGEDVVSSDRVIMAKSLQEQLLESGAARPKQARKARREKSARKKQARQQGQRPDDEKALQQQIAAAEAAKRERDDRLNAEQKARRQAHERDQAVSQIVTRNRIQAGDEITEPVPYNYTDGRTIRRIEVSDRQRRDLAAGRLAIVRHENKAHLVPRSVAERLMEHIPEQVWLVSGDEPEPDPDDPYAEFQVPDDLMW